MPFASTVIRPRSICRLYQRAATPESAQQFREHTGCQGPMLADDGTVGPAFAALHCPKLWLLDSDGIARWTAGGDGDARPPAALVKDLLEAMPTQQAAVRR